MRRSSWYTVLATSIGVLASAAPAGAATIEVHPGPHFVGNVAHGNHTKGFLDEGSGNCGSGNSFPIPHC